MKKSVSKLAIASIGIFAGSVALATDLTIFAAASMTNVMQQIGEDYKKQYPEDNLQFSFASSSVLAKQIEQDAPADVFVSADLKWMKYVEEKQPERTKNVAELVKNDLVLIAPKASDLTAGNIQDVDFKALLKDEYLAVGDPAHVPAGRYAQKALTHFNLWETVEPRLARAKNVRDALTLVERGESPLGIVYSTDAKVSNKVKVIGIFPNESYGEVVYPVATVSDKIEAKRFVDYLSTPSAKQHFQQAGFKTVE